MQTQLLPFCKNIAKVSSLPLLKITTISTHFFPAKNKIPILGVELQTKKIQKVSTPNGKIFANRKDFLEKCE